MKSKRQNRILEVIVEQAIETQEELVRVLNDLGFKVTQATVSRDIKELGLVKIQSEPGKYRYSANKKNEARDLDILIRIFADTVISVVSAENLVIIKTLSGSANAAAEVIDSFQYEEILGCIAGDNTIFIATDSVEAANYITKKFLNIIK